MASKALLTGINNYKSISDLRGCLNDVDDMRNLLIEHYDFDERYVRTLKDEEVTKDNLEKQWRWLFSSVNEGDRVVFHFSGHGSQIRDDDGDEDSDGVDEILCLWDMSWYEPESYLRDDELRTMTQRLPEGAFLTVILDCCHSGTATRMIQAPHGLRAADRSPEKMPLVDLETSLARMGESSRGGPKLASREGARTIERVLYPSAGETDRDAVLVRYVAPPQDVLGTLSRAGIRTRLRDVVRDEVGMNHILYAGSRDNQTSADAFIDRDFHGAFTYYFCDTVRSAYGRIGHREAIEGVRESLRRNDFEQVPQLEPDGTTGLLFHDGGDYGGHGSSERPATDAQSDVVNSGYESAIGRQVGDEIAAAIRLTIRHEMEQLCDSLRKTARSASATRGEGERALVYVHGICKHELDYWHPWWNVLRVHLNSALLNGLGHGSNVYGVHWSNHVNRALQTARSLERSVDAHDFQAELRGAILDRASQKPDSNMTAGTGFSHRSIAGVLDFLPCADDFARYMVHNSVRDAILGEFAEVVRPLLFTGNQIDIISHSWGTVVAYEGLRQLEQDSFPGRVNNLFTVGAALSLWPVRWRLRTNDGRKPRIVRRWVNLNAEGDAVGGALGSHFGGVRDELDLKAVGCENDGSISCAHGSYFRAANTHVNRDIFSRHMKAF